MQIAFQSFGAECAQTAELHMWPITEIVFRIWCTHAHTRTRARIAKKGMSKLLEQTRTHKVQVIRNISPPITFHIQLKFLANSLRGESAALSHPFMHAHTHTQTCTHTCKHKCKFAVAECVRSLSTKPKNPINVRD